MIYKLFPLQMLQPQNTSKQLCLASTHSHILTPSLQDVLRIIKDHIKGQKRTTE